VADAFVSYVSEDRAIAEKIARGLEGAGISVWWDRHIPGGVAFRKEIDRQLSAAKVVVVLWSAASLDSEWVCDEAQQAREDNKLIPVRLDNVQPPLGFRQAQTLDFVGWNGDPKAGAFASLIDSARHFLDGPSKDAPRSIVPSVTPKHGRWRVPKAGLLAAVAIMAVVAVVAALRLGSTASPSDTASGRVEIGAFESLARAEDTAHFAKELTDAIRRVFAANEIKTVALREGTVANAGDVPATTEFRLRGTVDRDGEQYVVAADILHQRDGLVLWSKTLRQDVETVPQFREHVADYVARVLNCALRYRVLAKGDVAVDLFSRFVALCDANANGESDQSPALARRIVDAAPQYGISHAILAASDAFLTIFLSSGSLYSRARAGPIASRGVWRCQGRNGA